VSFFSLSATPKKNLQGQLFLLAGISLFLLATILTLSPVVRYRSWHVDFSFFHWLAFLIWAGGAYLTFYTTSRYCSNCDPILLPTAFLLAGWGMLTIWRLNFIFGIRQSVWFISSVMIANLFMKEERVLDFLKKRKYVILTLGLLLAILTFLFGAYPGGEGPKLWLKFGGIYFQPSEPLKLILIIYLAAFFSEKYQLKFNLLQSIFPTLILVGSALFILVGQRDLGTALIFIVIYIGMLYTIFGKKRILGIGAIILALATVFGYLFIDLIRIRFQAWIQPWYDAQSGSYQIIQSIIAIAAGGVFGTGIGIGYPRLVPIPHSDFIFSSIAEETGLIGSIALIGLITLIFYRSLHIALKTANRFHRFLSAGISIFLAFQTILIIGGNIRLLPITGVTLPLVSYGGSSLITSVLAIFILAKISDCPAKQRSRPNELVPFSAGAAIFSTALILLALVTGWWAVVRSNDLQLRPDNSRNLIAASYVKRGTMLDRNGQNLTDTKGVTGDYQHTITYPPLSNTLGFFHQTYGIAGLEKTYDDYLAGRKGYPAFNIWFNYLLYDQPLPGRDVKLTLDKNIQQYVDSNLEGYNGAAVILNPANGEILAISSQPNFDANTLDTHWETWNKDENAPFLNRATQGSYPLGSLITTLLVAEDETILEKDLAKFSLSGEETCAIRNTIPKTWSQAIKNGCPQALSLALEDQSTALVTAIIQNSGLNATIDIGLPVNTPQTINENATSRSLFAGSQQLRASPFQVAFAFSPFSNNGRQVIPQILSAIDTQQESWVTVANPQVDQQRSEESVRSINHLLSSDRISGWELSSYSNDDQGGYSWYVAGTPYDWNGTPCILVLVIENADALKVRQIGRSIFTYTGNPQ